MRRPLLFMFVAYLTTVTGCRSNPRKDLVQAELRVKDSDLRELKSELERSHAYNQCLQRELRAIQGMVPPPVAGGAPGVVAGLPSTRVCSLTLGRQTSGIDDDGMAGDEALQVVLEPRDADNHTIKGMGNVLIQVLEVTSEGVKRPLCSWQVDPEILRKSWRNGLFGSGYSVALSWKTWPTNAKLRVLAQFVTEDGRLLEADKDVVVKLAPESLRKPPVIEEPKLPGLPREGDLLPSPRKVEPEKKDDVEGPPIIFPTAKISVDDRPLRGAVEILKPVFNSE